jgi:hypothetical protein
MATPSPTDPKVGDVVLYYPGCKAVEPAAAIVVKVHSPTRVNLTAFDIHGNMVSKINVGHNSEAPEMPEYWIERGEEPIAVARSMPLPKRR